MSIRERLSGNEATAIAMKQINPDVVAAFPITPSTEIPQYFSTFVSNGKVDTEFVAVESEHSAMSACIGAEAAGSRAMTATSANGLSLMWEMIYIASSLMVCQDGFITSHSIENIELLEDDKVKSFVGTYKPDHYLLNRNEPMAIGPLDLQAYLFEHKYQQSVAMQNAKKVILDVAKEFEELTGRKYSFFEEYKLNDAEIAIVCMNSTAGTTKYVVDNLRKKGIKAGLLLLYQKVRVLMKLQRHYLD